MDALPIRSNWLYLLYNLKTENMKELTCVVVLIIGVILVGFGNDLGLLGLIPATILLLVDDVKESRNKI